MSVGWSTQSGCMCMLTGGALPLGHERKGHGYSVSGYLSL